MNDESRILKKEIVLSEDREAFVKVFLFVDDLPKTVDLNIRLAGRASRAEVTMLYIGRNKDETEMNIAIVHEAPETYGRAIIKAALFDESRLTVKGMLDIREGAKGADSYLLAKALLVSPKARAEVCPYLEILTDEVKASHGTSIGRIDERQLFYLQSRGIAEEEGKRLLLAEFFRDAVKSLADEDRRKFFQSSIA
ncbi:MAG: SufD family Fe-S cluster assembly protein [Candidatus Sungbacteria bacterium]|nr:SufD family Fe-S cluster assembly protein [Candidatus Sungbacteria bacterium]